MRDQKINVLRLLVVVALIEVAIAGARRYGDAQRLLSGDVSTEALSGALGLLWLPVMAVVLGLAARELARLRHGQQRDTQSIAAGAATSRDWVWQSGSDLVITSSNDSVQEILGYTADEVIGRHTTELLAPSSRAMSDEIAARTLAEGTGWQDIEARWRHRDGHEVVLHSSASCILDHQGKVTALCGTRRPVITTESTRHQVDTARRQVREVLASGSVQAAGQPIIDLVTGELAGVEALARFADGRRPDLWFTQAADVGLGTDLELLAIEAALPHQAQLPDGAYLSVNASPAVILDPRLARVLTGPGVVTDRLVLEITEHVEVNRYDDLITALAPLRARSVRLAVDDTGAGYASFQHVLRLRPDVIKLDRSLVTGIDTDAGCRAFVTAIVLMALEMGSTVTGEGVETAAELDTLVSLGVDHAQGYLLGRPTLDHTNWGNWATTT